MAKTWLSTNSKSKIFTIVPLWIPTYELKFDIEAKNRFLGHIILIPEKLIWTDPVLNTNLEKKDMPTTAFRDNHLPTTTHKEVPMFLW